MENGCFYCYLGPRETTCRSVAGRRDRCILYSSPPVAFYGAMLEQQPCSNKMPLLCCNASRGAVVIVHGFPVHTVSKLSAPDNKSCIYFSMINAFVLGAFRRASCPQSGEVAWGGLGLYGLPVGTTKSDKQCGRTGASSQLLKSPSYFHQDIVCRTIGLSAIATANFKGCSK